MFLKGPKEPYISKTNAQREGRRKSNAEHAASESFLENHILKRYLFCKKCNSAMISQFISLSKDRIKRLPGSLESEVHRYSP